MKYPTVPLDHDGRWVPNPPYYIRFKGAWDMQVFYENMIDWFRKKKYKFHERIYKHKHPSPFGVERQYIWLAEKEEEDYVKSTFEVYFHTYDAHDIEIIANDGTKRVFTKGRVWIEIKNYTLLDWEGRWNENAFYAHLKSFYNRYVIRRRFTEGWAPRLRYEAFELHTFVKRMMNMENSEYEHMYSAGIHRKIP